MPLERIHESLVELTPPHDTDFQQLLIFALESFGEKRRLVVVKVHSIKLFAYKYSVNTHKCTL